MSEVELIELGKVSEETQGVPFNQTEVSGTGEILQNRKEQQ